MPRAARRLRLSMLLCLGQPTGSDLGWLRLSTTFSLRAAVGSDLVRSSIFRLIWATGRRGAKRHENGVKESLSHPMESALYIYIYIYIYIYDPIYPPASAHTGQECVCGRQWEAQHRSREAPASIPEATGGNGRQREAQHRSREAPARSQSLKN